MPRAFDRGVPPVDKNPLISATSWGDPGTIIGEAAATAGVQIQQFLFDWVYSLFEDCVAFLEDLKLLGEGDNPLAQLGTGLQSVIDQLFDIFFCGNTVDLTPTALISGLQDFLEPIQNNAFVQGLVAFAEFLGRETGVFLRDVFEGLLGLVDWICGIFTCNPNNSGSTPQTIVDGLSAFIDPLINNVFIQGLLAFAQDIGVAVGNVALDIFNGVLGMVEALCSLVTTGALPETYGSWANTPAQIVDDIAAIVGQLLDNPIVNGLRDLIAGTGNVLYDTISGLLVFINDLVGLLGQVMSGPQAIIDFLSGLLGEDGLLGWIDSLPFIGPLVSKLTGFDSSGDLALDLAQLGTWAQGLLTNTSSIPAAQLIGSIPAAVLGSIPVSAINLVSANLLGQGAFANANTVEAGGGWAWDGTTTATGSGGSVKATATGSLQRLYSRQTIRVTSGDRVNVSAMVKTSGFTSGSMVLSVIPWIGTAEQTAHVVHTRTTAATTFQSMSGSTIRIGGTAGAGEIALSGSITSLTVTVSVTANSGAQVWFDDISATKVGNLQQTLVESLIAAWNEIWRGLTNPLLPTITGKTWEDLFGAASGFRSVFNTEQDRGNTLRLNLFGNPNTVGSTIAEGAVPTIGQGKVSGLPAALAARELATNTLQSTIAQGYQIDYPTNGSSWAKPAGLSELYVVCFGGGAKGANGTVNTGGAGGVNGGYVAAQIDVDDVPASVLVTIGGNTSTSSTPTTFGSLLSSEESYKGYVATPVGLIQTAGQPGSGGGGGSSASNAGKAGQSTAIGSVGGAGGSGASTTFPQPGGNGGNGVNFGLSVTGGAGGGGGSYSTNGPGANGGAGGFPGGGGGGGGGYQSVISNPTGAPGIGGNGGLGYMLVIYKVARTTT